MPCTLHAGSSEASGLLAAAASAQAGLRCLFCESAVLCAQLCAGEMSFGAQSRAAAGPPAGGTFGAESKAAEALSSGATSAQSGAALGLPVRTSEEQCGSAALFPSRVILPGSSQPLPATQDRATTNSPAQRGPAEAGSATGGRASVCVVSAKKARQRPGQPPTHRVWEIQALPGPYEEGFAGATFSARRALVLAYPVTGGQASVCAVAAINACQCPGQPLKHCTWEIHAGAGPLHGLGLSRWLEQQDRGAMGASCQGSQLKAIVACIVG